MAEAFKSTRETLDLDKNDHMVLFSSETGLGKDQAWTVLESFM